MSTKPQPRPRNRGRLPCVWCNHLVAVRDAEGRCMRCGNFGRKPPDRKLLADSMAKKFRAPVVEAYAARAALGLPLFEAGSSPTPNDDAK